jgi:cytochrome oxidase Cu insertion factor (SCO1/SenC/PrrC family)
MKGSVIQTDRPRRKDVVKQLMVLFLALIVTAAGGSAAPAIDPVHATLVDQSGHAFSFAELRGAPVVVTFIATRCRDACPMINAWFMKLQAEVQRRHLKVTLLTITLDPEFDTPKIMASEARALRADARLWKLGSGSVASVDAIMAAFRVHPERDEHGIPDIHTTFVYVLNSQGKVADVELASANLVSDTVAVLHRL